MKVAADGWFRLDVPVRFRDVDAMGHAHHTLPLIYLEEARAAFWRLIKRGPDAESPLADIDYVMAEVVLRFHGRVLYPSTVTVGLAVRRVGAKSFSTDFEVRDAEGALLSSGSSVQVAYDYANAVSMPIAASDRAHLEAWRDAGARDAGGLLGADRAFS
jgi:acyl-CoA thioester hydrolase